MSRIADCIEKAMQPLVWILVLHWRGAEKTESCLASLEKLQYENFRVLLVDNGSESEDGNRLLERFPAIELLRLDSNLGFSGGCNAGMRYCLERDSEFIWLLNNDTLVYPEALSKLVEAACQNPDAGALGAALVRREPDTGKYLANAGLGEIDFFSARTFLRPVDAEEPAPLSCTWLSGSNLLLRKKALERVGLLNDDYFLYFEDVELCFRLKQCGFRCLLVPQARIEHEEGGSTGGDLRIWRYYYHARNRCIFFFENTPAILKPIALSRIYLHFARHFLTLPFRGEEGKRKLRAESQALRDFFAGKRGRSDIS